jgi:hypothetical protein
MAGERREEPQLGRFGGAKVKGSRLFFERPPKVANRKS